MKFLADIMLKKLCRWLRLLGISCIYAGDFSEDDDEIIKEAMRKNAVLLTMDKKMYKKATDYVKAFLVTNDDLDGQIAEVLKRFKIKISEVPAKTICPLCNGKLEEVKKDELTKKEKEKIFPHILETHEIFWRCKKCGQIYWKGTHWKNMEKRIEKIRKLLN